ADYVLKAMRRGYDRAQYMEKVRVLRAAVPGVALTTDIIVGFPGETDADFEDTLSALQEVRYHQIFSFKFSPRPMTKALTMPGQVSEEQRAERLAHVHAVQEGITADYHRKAEGSEEEVLIEGLREVSNQPFGRTRTNKIVNLESSDGVRIGDVVLVKITKGLKHSLLGRVTRT
ncbi:MAG: TRAM domain-containing protein, partial [Pseudomonadota bacterium]